MRFTFATRNRTVKALVSTILLSLERLILMTCRLILAKIPTLTRLLNYTKKNTSQFDDKCFVITHIASYLMCKLQCHLHIMIANFYCNVCFAKYVWLQLCNVFPGAKCLSLRFRQTFSTLFNSLFCIIMQIVPTFCVALL